MLIFFIAALALLVLAVFTWTQSDDAGFNKAKGAFEGLNADLVSTRNSLNKFVETCEDLTARVDAINAEVASLKEKQAKIDERLLPSKIEQHVLIDRPISLKPIQVELITRSAPLLERAGVTPTSKPPPMKKRPRASAER